MQISLRRGSFYGRGKRETTGEENEGRPGGTYVNKKKGKCYDWKQKL
jgi:hypothetical protein